MKKKISIALSMILVVCVIMAQTVTAFAASPLMTIGDATATPGSTVSIPISISDNPGLVSINLYVNYDESVFSLSSRDEV